MRQTEIKAPSFQAQFPQISSVFVYFQYITYMYFTNLSQLSRSQLKTNLDFLTSASAERRKTPDPLSLERRVDPLDHGDKPSVLRCGAVKNSDLLWQQAVG